MIKKANKKLKIEFHPEFWKSVNKLFSNNLYYLIPRKLNDWRYEIKWAWQRVFRGYDDRITWDLHYYISEYLPKIIRIMKDNVHGHPASIIEDKSKWEVKSVKDWKNVLEKIANGFDAARKIENDEYMKEIKLKKPKKDIFGKDSYTSYKYDKKCYNKLYKDFEEGIDLMKHFYFNLWD